MKKYLFLIISFCLFLFPFTSKAMVITRADLEEEAESLKEYAVDSGSSSTVSISFTDDRMIVDINDGEKTNTYEYNYTLSDESTEFVMTSEVSNGMTKEEYNEATEYFTGMIIPHLMISHLNGVSYDDALAYYISMGNDNILNSTNQKSYVIVESGVETEVGDNYLVIQSAEFPNRVTELAEWIYSSYEISDANDIYTYSASVNTVDNTSTISFRALYRNNAIYSNMDGESSKWNSEIDDDLPIDFGNNKKTSPKTSTNVKVPNTAINFNNLVYVLGLIAILIGLLSVNKVVKRKSN